jgi:hypothetical protein
MPDAHHPSPVPAAVPEPPRLTDLLWLALAVAPLIGTGLGVRVPWPAGGSSDAGEAAGQRKSASRAAMPVAPFTMCLQCLQDVRRDMSNLARARVRELECEHEVSL